MTLIIIPLAIDGMLNKGALTKLITHIGCEIHGMTEITDANKSQYGKQIILSKFKRMVGSLPYLVSSQCL